MIYVGEQRQAIAQMYKSFPARDVISKLFM